MTPLAASRPKAEPPERTIASISLTSLSGSSSGVSLLPGAPPRIEIPAVKGLSAVMTVTPDLSVPSAALPTFSPSISVIRLVLPGCIMVSRLSCLCGSFVQFLPPVQCRLDKCAGDGFTRLFKHVCCRAVLDDLPACHHHNTGADSTHHR